MAVAAKNHSDNIKFLKEAQEAEYDNREKAREADHFLNKRDGQWEPQIVQKFRGKPRYTFDECNPIVDDIMGEMEAMDFNIYVSPSGALASKQTAQQYEGIIRTLENISGARFIYNQAARRMVSTGIDGWRVVHRFRDDDSFQQDLMVVHVPNFIDTVWFDPDSIERDASDSECAWSLISMTKKKYEEKWPKGSGLSVGQNVRQQVYPFKKPYEVIVGEYLYRKIKKRKLVLMNNGAVYVVNDDFMKVKDELAAKGIEVTRERERPYHVVYRKFFDGGDWLDDSKETVFSYVPLVPIYGNFAISENKVIYWGIIEKLMDPQRVINYAQSRKIEEGALSPRGKYWATKEQAQSADVRQTLRTLNTNSDPVQLYDHVEGQPPPYYQGSPPSNPGLVETSQSAQQFIQRTSGTFDEARGAAPAHRSGEAIGLLQAKSDNPKRKWFTAVEVGITHTCRIMVQAIPRVYDTQQEMVLTGQDGTTDVITIQQRVVDEDTGDVVELNDLTKGSYSVVCTAGPAFQSKQQETVTAITEFAKIDPTILQLGGDVLLNNIAAPGIEKIAERKRLNMVIQGMIPANQMTEEEKQLYQQVQQQSQGKTSPIDQANLMIAQAQVIEAQGKNQERDMKFQLEDQKLQLKRMELAIKERNDSEVRQLNEQRQLVDAVTAAVQQIKTQAETLNLIREAMGVDAILGPGPAKAYSEQAKELTQSITRQ